MRIDFLDYLSSRLDNQLIDNSVDVLLVDSFDEIVEKIDFDKHYSNSEIEKIVAETIEMIVVKIVTSVHRIQHLKSNIELTSLSYHIEC